MDIKAHVLVAVLTASTLLFIVRLIRLRQLRAKYSFLWLSVGSVMVVMAALPQLLDLVSRWVGIFYAPATFFMAAIFLLLLIAVHFSWELSRLEERTRILAEELALITAQQPDASA